MEQYKAPQDTKRKKNNFPLNVADAKWWKIGDTQCYTHTQKAPFIHSHSV